MIAVSIGIDIEDSCHIYSNKMAINTSFSIDDDNVDANDRPNYFASITLS